MPSTKKLEYEAAFTKRLPSGSPYAGPLPELDRLYSAIEPYALAREYYTEIALRNVDLPSLMGGLKRMISAYEKNGEAGYKEQLARVQNFIPEFYKDFDSNIDQEKLGTLLTMYADKLDKKFVPDFLQRENLGIAEGESYDKMVPDLYTLSCFTSEKEATGILSLSPEKAVQAIKSGPVYAMSSAWADFYANQISAPYNEIKKEIDLKQAIYTGAQMEVFKEKRFYPDANSTLRVTYGQVNGYKPRDAVAYSPVTYLDGIIQKYVPGDYEFDLQLHACSNCTKTRITALTPIKPENSRCVSSAQTTPQAVIPEVRLLTPTVTLSGYNFDRVWEGTMSDIYYDKDICRNIMVDARYILWVIDKYAGAKHLIKEMTLVHPKKGKTSKTGKSKAKS